MHRLHVIGGKNHGKTTLVVELVEEFARRGIAVGTIKHTHHHHELDVPGKDSHRHRMAGAAGVGILSPSMTAMFVPTNVTPGGTVDRYTPFVRIFSHCQLILVEGDSQTSAPKIEVWRKERDSPPLAIRDKSILAIVTDDPVECTTPVLGRSDVRGLADWVLRYVLGESPDSATAIDLRD